MKIGHEIDSIRLTSSEMGELWTSYVYDSLSRCVLMYFSKTCRDKTISELIEYDLDVTQKNLRIVQDIFNSVNFPVPVGFTDEDVNINAGKLYSDNFMLYYIKIKTKFEMINYSAALAMSARKDVRELYNHCLKSELAICNLADEILLSKGLFVRSPYVPVPENIEFVKKQSFLSGFIGDKRPLNTKEIGYLYLNIQTNLLGKALLMGFGQVAVDKKVQEFIIRGKEMAGKHVEIFSVFLQQEDLPSPMSWDSEITDSTEPPFSDQLMMFHVVSLISYGMAAYGLSLASAFRRDVGSAYVRLMAEIAQYLDDGAKLMINNKWLEKVPEAPDRKELLNV